ncbi:hypothetical protein TorRG33x02_343160 [Trema orientale]|uniref:Uncharacterized protein n=1 Tax=Trema orientale TaxID=63057 RepID=A0A2P5ARQ2_TREOI|nr:hypothetical protein TorRG33x02_343160 [Trema orientale]
MGSGLIICLEYALTHKVSSRQSPSTIVEYWPIPRHLWLIISKEYEPIDDKVTFWQMPSTVVRVLLGY